MTSFKNEEDRFHHVTTHAIVSMNQNKDLNNRIKAKKKKKRAKKTL